MWKLQIEHFKNDFRIIAPALPGFGKSNYVNPCESITCMAKSILEFLKKLEIKRFHLLGYSMGGMIIQEISRLIEDQIDKLICYGTGPRGNIPGQFETIGQSREKLMD
jgi:2-hydroxy-6-oxonona-2,4-dienedioate hydrolase